MTVSELPEYLQFVNDSSEVQTIRENLALTPDEDFDSFFVHTKDGDYREVWGMPGILPRNDKQVFRVELNRMQCTSTPADPARKKYELIVRWGRPDEEDEPREAKIYTFDTEAERNAYRDGIIEAQPDTTRFDFYTRNADGTIPEDEEWEALYGESEE